MPTEPADQSFLAFLSDAAVLSLLIPITLLSVLKLLRASAKITYNPSTDIVVAFLAFDLAVLAGLIDSKLLIPSSLVDKTNAIYAAYLLVGLFLTGLAIWIEAFIATWSSPTKRRGMPWDALAGAGAWILASIPPVAITAMHGYMFVSAS